MKFDSPLFDRIRVKPDHDRRQRETQPTCDWPGCAEAASHRAPKGRAQEREYWCFCLDHVREYNHSYNYFAGMSADAVALYQKDALTGHRPTWKMGMVGGKRTNKPRSRQPFDGYESADDPFEMFREIDAKRPDIKARFKELVKRHHPDANGGDRGSEDKLREIIEAYHYLKSAGFG